MKKKRYRSTLGKGRFSLYEVLDSLKLYMLFFWCLCLFIFGSAFPLKAQEIALVLSADLKPYLEFAEGFQDLYPRSKLYILPEDTSLVKRYFKKGGLKAVAVGSRALALFQKAPLTLKIYYALLVSPEEAHKILPGRTLCGLYLKLPPQLTFPIIKETLQKEWPSWFERPSPLKMLIPYSAETNKTFLEEARKLGPNLGFEILPYRIERVPELKRILLEEDFDLLYCVPDPIYATEEVIASVLETCLLRHRPACGYNHFFYRKGALLAFVFDYYEMGKQLAQMLLSERCEEAPAHFKVLLNKKVLKFLRKNFYLLKSKNVDQ